MSIQSLITVLALILVMTAALLWWLRSPDDGLNHYPHGFVAEATYEVDRIQFVAAPLDMPPPPPANLLPAWQCDDPNFYDSQQRPWIFPLADVAYETPPTLPLHPTLQRRPELKTCHRYRSATAQMMLDAYRKQHSP